MASLSRSPLICLWPNDLPGGLGVVGRSDCTIVRRLERACHNEGIFSCPCRPGHVDDDCHDRREARKNPKEFSNACHREFLPCEDARVAGIHLFESLIITQTVSHAAHVAGKAAILWFVFQQKGLGIHIRCI